LPEPGALAAAALLAIVPSLLYVVVLNAIDRYEKEPWTILLASLGLGAVAAPVLSIAILAATGRPAGLRPDFAPGPGGADPLVGIVEELVKGALLILLIRSIRDEFDDVIDGIVYGAALGAGFGATESLFFTAGGVNGLGGGTIAALLAAGLNHAFYTAILGALLGASRGLADRRQAWTVTALAVATAAFAHSFHDTLPYILSHVLGRPEAAVALGTRLLAQLANGLGILTLAIVVVAAWGREARVLREQLADEVVSGVVGPEDYATITSGGARLSRQLALLRTGGLQDVLALRRLYATEGELAFHKRRLAVRRRKRPSLDRLDELRTTIRELRHGLEKTQP
jgi:RsiW-degrading membrane proteinase PrsW (M82 family)